MLKPYGERVRKVRLYGGEKRRTCRGIHLLLEHSTHGRVTPTMTGNGALARREPPWLLGGEEGNVGGELRRRGLRLPRLLQDRPRRGARGQWKTRPAPKVKFLAVLPPSVMVNGSPVTSSDLRRAKTGLKSTSMTRTSR